jgi:hypothetical protein
MLSLGRRKEIGQVPDDVAIEHELRPMSEVKTSELQRVVDCGWLSWLKLGVL